MFGILGQAFQQAGSSRATMSAYRKSNGCCSWAGPQMTSTVRCGSTTGSDTRRFRCRSSLRRGVMWTRDPALKRMHVYELTEPIVRRQPVYRHLDEDVVAGP